MKTTWIASIQLKYFSFTGQISYSHWIPLNNVIIQNGQNHLTEIATKELEENNLAIFQLEACTRVKNVKSFRMSLSRYVSIRK